MNPQLELELRRQVSELKSTLRWLLLMFVVVVIFLLINLSSNIQEHALQLEELNNNHSKELSRIQDYHNASLRRVALQYEQKLLDEKQSYRWLQNFYTQLLSNVNEVARVQKRQVQNNMTRYAAPITGRLVRTITGSPYEADHIVALAILEGALFVIRDADDESVIEIYDKTTGKYKNSLTIPGMGTLSDMTSSLSHDCIYIIDSTNYAVYRIELTDGKYMYTEWSLSLTPRSISVTASSNVLVTFDTVAGEYSPSGELKRVVHLQADVKNPRQVIELDVDQFLVSDIYLGSNRLCIVNENGQKVKCVKAGSAHEPIHVAVHGFVYLTDADNDSVMMLTSSLTLVRDVIEELDMPYRIMHSDGQLYVADFDEETSSRLKLYRIME